jgi:hypothetical protein
MSDFDGFDLDRTTARAWGELQDELTVRLEAMEADDSYVIGTEGPDWEAGELTPYVQFARDAEHLYFEVSSNEFLTGRHQLTAAAEAALAELGLAAPDEEESPNHHLMAPAADAPRLAVIAVRVLRDVFGVPHPAFLEPNQTCEDPTVDTSWIDEDEPVATAPRDRDHLQEMVDRALAPVFGQLPDHDADGDIPVTAGSVLLFVRVLAEMPVVQLFSSVVEQIGDTDAAAFEVGVLNRDSLFIRWVLMGSRIMAYINLPSYPFVPEHLRSMVSHMSKTIDEVDDDLAVRVRGRRSFEPDDGDGEATPPAASPAHREVHAAMHTLLELDAESPGSVDADLAASVCGHDRDLILMLITESTEQEIAWREAQDEALLAGDAEEVAACRHELEHVERTTNLLRRALRIVVEAERDARRATRPSSRRRQPRPKSADVTSSDPE